MIQNCFFEGAKQDHITSVGWWRDLLQCLCEHAGLLPEPIQHAHRTVPPQPPHNKQLCVRWLRLPRMAGWPRTEYFCNIPQVTGEVGFWH